MITDYDDVLKTARGADLKWGDPAALGKAIMDAVAMEAPPPRLLVGQLRSS